MSTEKRTVLLVTLCLAWIIGAQYLLGYLGWLPKPKPPAPPDPPAAVAEADLAVPAPVPDPAGQGDKAPKVTDLVPVGPKVALVQEEIVLGSTDPKDGYNLRVRLSQVGAAVDQIELSKHEAERQFGKKDHSPLRLVQHDFDAPDSFALSVASFTEGQVHGKDLPTGDPLDTRAWEVVRDDKGRAVRPVEATKAEGPGQEVVFRTTIGDPAVAITKTFRLARGSDAIDLKVGVESPSAERRLVYRLTGPHGLPIEGEWYTSTFREVVFGQIEEKGTKLDSRLAADIVKRKDDPERLFNLPLKFAGVENQYFTVFLEPSPLPATDAERCDEETVATVIFEHPKEKQKSDVSITMKSRPMLVGPNRPVAHSFKIFAGPKTGDALAPYGAGDLATYRKTGWFSIPYAPTLARNVISPLLDRIYALTENVAHLVGWEHGNYGIAIILLTITVRLCLFPLSRRQALQAKKMQDIAPLLAALKEKYKDDKEAQMREHFALMKRNNVKMSTGCILAIIQLPIFVGLWQALNNSVALRHARFLWIDNLAAPDMLFSFGTDLPVVGRYFNLLPFAVMGLMLLQMHLFTPPASTPEQEQTQKFMKPMMIVMAFMFYKVPSGLGIYFITSSTWAICERLLLPKMVKSHPVDPGVEPDEGTPAPRSKPGPNGNGNGNGPKAPSDKPGWRERMLERLEQIKDDAEKNRTHRNVPEKERDRDWGKGNKSRPNKPPGRRR